VLLNYRLAVLGVGHRGREVGPIVQQELTESVLGKSFKNRIDSFAFPPLLRFYIHLCRLHHTTSHHHLNIMNKTTTKINLGKEQGVLEGKIAKTKTQSRTHHHHSK